MQAVSYLTLPRLWNSALVPAGKAVCWPLYRQTDFSLVTGSMFGTDLSLHFVQMLIAVIGWFAFLDLALALLPISHMESAIELA